jgi:hypothetical protein
MGPIGRTIRYVGVGLRIDYLLLLLRPRFQESKEEKFIEVALGPSSFMSERTEDLVAR